MADEETVKPPPAVACRGVLAQVERMRSDGIPDRIDKHFLANMADGTQFQYRQSFRSLGLTTDDDRPTSLLDDLVHAGPTDRPELFGMILSDRYPDLAGLSPAATKDDFFGVLRDRYRVASDMQRRKMLTFFVHAADYAKLQISPNLQPTRPGTGPRARKTRPSGRRIVRRLGAPTAQSPKTTTETPAVRADQGGQEASGRGTTQRHISFGDAGSVSIVVNVSWLDLPEEEFTKLRKLIKDIEALGESGS